MTSRSCAYFKKNLTVSNKIKMFLFLNFTYFTLQYCIVDERVEEEYNRCLPFDLIVDNMCFESLGNKEKYKE